MSANITRPFALAASAKSNKPMVGALTMPTLPENILSNNKPQLFFVWNTLGYDIGVVAKRINIMYVG
ncbi:MAG: hypothetical protein ACI843_000599 [Psychrobacter glaciei]|jgi:hypothetical protein